MFIPGTHRDEKVAEDALEVELQVAVTCGCWESNHGPLEKQSVLLITDPFLQSLKVHGL